MAKLGQLATQPTQAFEHRSLGAVQHLFAATGRAVQLAGGAQALLLIAQGLVPPDRLGALRRQGEIVPQLQEEFARWTYHLYRDRADGKTLRLGYGKHCGRPLEEARGFVAWALEQHEQQLLLGSRDRKPLPEEVYREFRRHIPAGSPLAKGIDSFLKVPGANGQTGVLPPDPTARLTPGALADIALKAMAKQPDDRFQTMEEMIEAIRSFRGRALESAE